MEHKRKKMLSEILLTSKRLQSTVDHSLVLLRQVQRDFSGESKAKAAAIISLGHGKMGEEQSVQKMPIPEMAESNGSGQTGADEEEEEEEDEGGKVRKSN
jgi:hypothetical protein